MKSALLASLGLALIISGEAFAFLGGLDALLFWGDTAMMRIGGAIALALSVLIGVWTFSRALRCERDMMLEG